MNNRKTLFLVLLALISGEKIMAQTPDERISVLEEQLEKLSEKQTFLPRIHGILRGKYEYEPGLEASRFEVRNARLSAEGNLPLRSSYKLEIDLCDESAIKMKDAWVRINPWSSLRATIGQQRMPFSIDAHRNPSAQYFANRSFIAKQVGDMRDVGFQLGYDFLTGNARKVLSIDAGVFNGSNLDNQKTAWFKSPGYSARIQYYPIKGLAIVPSVQHQQIADRKASYTSVDFGAYYEFSCFHFEAEYLRKFYAKDAFDDCNAFNAMAIYKQTLKKEKTFIQNISYLLRYDYMGNHSDGKKGFVGTLPLGAIASRALAIGELATVAGGGRGRLVQSDAERHRLTAGLTFSVRNKYFPTDIRLNYEKYWYPHGGAKESEQDKLVAEVMIRF